MMRGSLFFSLWLPLVFASVSSGIQLETDSRLVGQQVVGGEVFSPTRSGRNLSSDAVYVDGLAEPVKSPSRRPPVGMKAEWISDSETGMASVDLSVSLPLLFIRTPPPIVKVGVNYTSLQTPESYGISEDLFEYSLGVASVRKLNDRWNVRSILGIELATDNENRSSDAWRFRGGGVRDLLQN